ncbi:MAG: SPFH domain-containing protein [Alphaproteobacteria bacterium]
MTDLSNIGTVFKKAKKIAIRGLLPILAVAAVYDSFTVNDSQEQSVVTRMGNINRILGAGPHPKIPFFEQADKYLAGTTTFPVIDIPISVAPDSETPEAKTARLAQYETAGLAIYTTDEQPIYVKKFTLQIRIKEGEDLVRLHAKNRNWREQILSISEQALKAVSGQQHTADVPQNRDKIANDVAAHVGDVLRKRGIGIEVLGGQLNNYNYSAKYLAQIEDAAKAKAEQVKAKTVADTEAENKRGLITKAEGLADALKQNADAEAHSIRVKQDAEAYAITQKGNAEAAVLRANKAAEAQGITDIGKALRANPSIIPYTYAAGWKGSYPTYYVEGGAQRPAQMFNMPLPPAPGG